MSNITKQKRDQMLAFLEELKKEHSDDASVRAFNEIENHLKDKKFGLVFEEHTEEVDDLLAENIPVFCADESRRVCSDKDMPWNFLIEGDNLQALYLLEKTHLGKVSCIYIDPPYNTGAKDWKYNNDYVDSNDVYRHSKWLSMMKSRLVLAKRLLNPEDSVLICTIDEKEYLHLGCLLEELFPTAKIQMVSSVISHHGTSRFNEFSRVNEFIYFVMIGEYTIEPFDDTGYVKEGESIHWQSFRRSNPANVRASRPSQFYPIYINKKTSKIEKIGEPITPDVDRFSVSQIDGCETVFPVKDDGTEMMWSLLPSVLRNKVEKGYVRVGKYTPDKPQQFVIQYLMSGTIEDIENGKITINGYDKDGSVIAENNITKKAIPKTQWDYATHDARNFGTKILKNVLGELRFSFPKSLYAVRDCLYLFLANKPDAVVVDFFAGSGTTMHAVNLLNAQDGGHRKCIMITNNEISADEEKRLTAQGYKKGDKEWETLGIAQYVTWPRTVCSIEGHDVNGNALKGDYIANDKEGNPIPMSRGFKCNIKYFKCDWTKRKPEDYLLSNALCLHIKEMIEIQNAIEIDGEKNVLLLNKDDIRKNILDPVMYDKAENVWLNQNIILNADEMKLLKKKGFKYIPREFFGQELREVAE